MKYFKTKIGMPITTNCPGIDLVEITEKEYDNIVEEQKNKYEEEEKLRQENIQQIVEQENKIQAKLKEFALKELEEEDANTKTK